ncbi:hypothetical protein ACVRWL_09940 [Streptococcus ratti]|uniref:hypothetical protein n=1 Tax=Streptococcus ratti TaxID=1341 RepID=UPI001FE46381|nr:hypothetical protein [Streptococcus ratti]
MRYSFIDFRNSNKDGKWFVANPRFVDYNNPTRIRDVEEYYVGRNYTVFSVLANVRNYDNIPFIQENRGLPKDITQEVRKEANEWNDGHSFGWVTLEELSDYFYKYQDSKAEVFKEAANDIRRLYFECWYLSFNIRDDSYNSLDVNDMRYAPNAEAVANYVFTGLNSDLQLTLRKISSS